MQRLPAVSVGARGWLVRPAAVQRLMCALGVLLSSASMAIAQVATPHATSSSLAAPAPVRDLHWGEALFYFYQDDHLGALSRLGAAEHFSRVTHHQHDAQLLKGGLYLSLGQHAEAGRIFQQLLDAQAPLDVRNRAWFYLGKVWYQRGYLEQAQQAFASIHGALPDTLEPERQLLQAQVLLQLEQFEPAMQTLQRWQPTRPADLWSAYARFNLGAALVRQDRLDAATPLLGAVGEMSAPSEEAAALKDKANLALGFALLKAQRADEAKTALQKVRLHGPLSNKALLGVGWADSAQQRYAKALAPWLELQGRNLLDAAVQESYLAAPYAYAQLGATQQAVERYLGAIEAFSAESARIEESIRTIRGGSLLDAVLRDEDDKTLGWYWRLQQLPDAPETRYLFHLLATHEFQEGLKNYRDVKLMQRNLQEWARSAEAFDDMVDTRRRAYAQRLPALAQTLDTVDLRALEARKLELEARVQRIEQESDIAALGSTRELAQWRKLERIEAVLAAADPNDPLVQEMREKSRLLRGRLTWEFSASYKARLWRARKTLRELDVAYKEARRRSVLVERARSDYPQRTEAFAARVDALQPRIADLISRLEQAAGAQSALLAHLAVKELEAQQQRLAAYSLQARFALASIYDRTSSGGGE